MNRPSILLFALMLPYMGHADDTADCDDPGASTCVIACNGDDACKSAGNNPKTLQCADDKNCEVSCSGKDACNGATLNCPSAPHACDVYCMGSGSNTCSGLKLHAEKARALSFSCDAASSGCGLNAKIYCPTGGGATSCAVSCASPNYESNSYYMHCWSIDVYANLPVGSVSVSCSGKSMQLCSYMNIRAGGTNALDVDCSNCTYSGNGAFGGRMECCYSAKVSTCPAAMVGCGASCPASKPWNQVGITGTSQFTCINQNCGAGKFKNITGAKACKDCPACEDCPAGFYQNQNQHTATTCVDCPEGFYTGAGATACSACAAGKYQDQTGAEACKACAWGMFQNQTGAEACTLCPSGFIQLFNGTACVNITKEWLEVQYNNQYCDER